MPPYLSIPHYHLSRLPVTTKVALTGFSLSLLGAILFVTIAVFGERTGYEVRGVQANFAGDERVTRETGAAVDHMVAEKSRRALYDIVHPHSFMIPLVYFVLCHLMEMTYAPRGFKIALYAGSFLAMALVTAAPLLVAWKLAFGWVVIPAVVGLGGAFLVMIVLPTWQMWFTKDRA
ncbi:MAG: hypothetical protein ACK44W_15985 [Planctomycetota bacterium]